MRKRKSQKKLHLIGAFELLVHSPSFKLYGCNEFFSLLEYKNDGIDVLITPSHHQRSTVIMNDNLCDRFVWRSGVIGCFIAPQKTGLKTRLLLSSWVL